MLHGTELNSTMCARLPCNHPFTKSWICHWTLTIFPLKVFAVTVWRLILCSWGNLCNLVGIQFRPDCTGYLSCMVVLQWAINLLWKLLEAMQILWVCGFALIHKNREFFSPRKYQKLWKQSDHTCISLHFPTFFLLSGIYMQYGIGWKLLKNYNLQKVY